MGTAADRLAAREALRESRRAARRAEVAELAARRRSAREARRSARLAAREATRSARLAAREAHRAEVRRLRAEGVPVAELAARFGCSKSTISGFASGVSWGASALEGPGASESWRLADDLGPVAVARPAPVAIAPRPSPRPSPPPESDPWEDGTNRGSANGSAKLDETAVAELLGLRDADPRRWTYPALAARYGVSRSTVFYILSGRNWQHVGPARGGSTS